jgi:hypothetical protein
MAIFEIIRIELEKVRRARIIEVIRHEGADKNDHHTGGL